MKTLMKSSAIAAIVLSVIGGVSAFAIPAMTSKGTGCAVRTGPGAGDYAFDEACTYHQVVKLNNDGTVAFFTYQDHGQIIGDWRPDRAMRTEAEVCYTVAPYGTVCGTTTEIVAPGGEYKSSFKAR